MHCSRYYAVYRIFMKLGGFFIMINIPLNCVLARYHSGGPGDDLGVHLRVQPDQLRRLDCRQEGDGGWELAVGGRRSLDLERMAGTARLPQADDRSVSSLWCSHLHSAFCLQEETGLPRTAPPPNPSSVSWSGLLVFRTTLAKAGQGRGGKSLRTFIYLNLNENDWHNNIKPEL